MANHASVETHRQKAQFMACAHVRSRNTDQIVPIQCYYWRIHNVNKFMASVDIRMQVYDWRSGVRGFDPCRVWQHSFVEINHGVFSTVILSCLLIQEGQLSVSGECAHVLVNRLEDQACPGKKRS